MKTPALHKFQPLIAALEAEPLTDHWPETLTGCYISDLLSDVLAHAEPGMLWLTIQTHRNVVSVAATKDITAVLFTCGRKPEPEIIAEAEEEGIALLTTKLTTYEASGKLWRAGVHGENDHE
ncbi:MAG TPA: DRTGG domain-containing protein [Verrucomicrobiae bacterium]|nr:DRTGG domain-containing protein [Verrucomicrobiae bacterium]